MKKNLIILVLVFTILKLYGQEYFEITFDGEGAMPETVIVENLTQGTDLEMDGADILHLLLQPIGINEMETGSKKLTIFPNPMDQSGNIEFYNANQGDVIISLYNTCGKLIQKYRNVFTKGNHTFSLTGVAAGIYVLRVKTETDLFTGQFVSVGQTNSVPLLIYKEKKTEPSHIELRNVKSNKSIVEMDFAIGNELRFIGIADGFNNDTIYASPADDQTYTFVFIQLYECGEPFTDTRDGNIYQTVLIGDQCWMAENLAYLPDITFEGDWGSDIEPQYAVSGYAPGSGTETVAGAKASEHYQNYGVLYNWVAAMDGSESSSENPSGVQGICPPGWHLPSHDEWTELIDYVVAQGYPNEPDNPNGAAKALKSCRQVNSPLGGICDTNEHPRWNSHSTNFGIDEFGFAGLPGGFRHFDSIFFNVGSYSRWWTTSLHSAELGISRGMSINIGYVPIYYEFKENGNSVRCLRD